MVAFVCRMLFRRGSILELAIFVLFCVPFKQMFWNFSCNWKHCLHAFAFAAALWLVFINLSKVLLLVIF